MPPQEAVHIGTCAALAFCPGDVNNVQAIDVLGLLSFINFPKNQKKDIANTSCPRASSQSLMPRRGSDPFKVEEFGALGTLGETDSVAGESVGNGRRHCWSSLIASWAR
jgi:hypothetical protein